MTILRFLSKADIYLRVREENNNVMRFNGTCETLRVNYIEPQSTPTDIHNLSSEPFIISLEYFESYQDVKHNTIEGLAKALAQSILEGDLVAAYALADLVKDMDRPKQVYCSTCCREITFEEKIRTVTHHGYLTLCRSCYTKAGNSVR